MDSATEAIVNSIQVKFGKDMVTLTMADPEQVVTLQLASDIVPDECESKPSGLRIELKLKKSKEGINWMSLEPGASMAAAPVPI